jgi:hypothetical protein
MFGWKTAEAGRPEVGVRGCDRGLEKLLLAAPGLGNDIDTEIQSGGFSNLCVLIGATAIHRTKIYQTKISRTKISQKLISQTTIGRISKFYSTYLP